MKRGKMPPILTPRYIFLHKKCTFFVYGADEGEIKIEIFFNDNLRSIRTHKKRKPGCFTGLRVKSSKSLFTKQEMHCKLSVLFA
jgi:hypothetical protein